MLFLVYLQNSSNLYALTRICTKMNTPSVNNFFLWRDVFRSVIESRPSKLEDFDNSIYESVSPSRAHAIPNKSREPSKSIHWVWMLHGLVINPIEARMRSREGWSFLISHTSWYYYSSNTLNFRVHSEAF